jgi:selenocysteine lyase/cysteine desulfurase
VHGGSLTMASVGSAVQAACHRAREEALARGEAELRAAQEAAERRYAELEHAREQAERCRELLRDAGADALVPEERATLVSWRPRDEDTAAVVAWLAAVGVIVRDLPGTGLVRASVGWWTSDDDLDRLVAGLAR